MAQKRNNADKLYKKAIKDQQKRLKPGECEKYIRIVLEQTFASSGLGQLLQLELGTMNIKTASFSENCIYWERSVGQRQFISNDDLALITDLNDDWQMENQVIKLLRKSELEYHVKQKSLGVLCKQFKKEFPDKRLSLLVSSIKDNKKSEVCNDIAKALVDIQVLEEMPIIEFQEDPKELADLLRRFTKAIAEIPFKQKQTENMSNFKKYLVNDKKQCVRVVGTMGLGRLWQQHLNRLPNVTLDVAEALISKHKCPKSLLDAYKNDPDAVEEIADLKLNRINAPQPLQSERRIGNVLSSKLFTLYNTRDPNARI